MEVYAFGLAVFVGLIALVIWLLRTNTRITIEKDNAENDVKILQKQRDNNITTVADALRVFKRK